LRISQTALDEDRESLLDCAIGSAQEQLLFYQANDKPLLASSVFNPNHMLEGGLINGNC
jgi:hypothetical protein